MEVISKGKCYRVKSDLVHEEEILITEATATGAVYTVVKTKLDNKFARHFAGSFGTFVFNSEFHGWLEDSSKHDLKVEFNNQLEEIIGEDIQDPSGRKETD